MSRIAFIATLLILMPWGSSAGTADSTKATQEIQRLEQLYGGHLGMMAKNLKTGEVLAYNPAERFPTASAIKLPVMAAFFNLVSQHKIDPGMKVALTAKDKKPGSGVLQFLSEGATITLIDAVRLMIDLSDNTGTNLVLDRLAPTHAERMSTVNDFLIQKGLKNTRLLNRLYSWETKQQTPEAIRYGIGVATPEDMVALMESLYRGTLVDTGSSRIMLDILKQQFYNDMIPRYLPSSGADPVEVAHKTGGINETKVDVGLVLSGRLTMAIAIFVDKHPDHAELPDNQAVLLAAHVARAAWNHFTGGSGYDHAVVQGDVDWTKFPGGSWAIYRSAAAPFPHPERANGYRRTDGTGYPFFPHYADSSIVVVVPDGFHETALGSNIIVHFHGHMNEDVGGVEKYRMPQALVSQKINALLVLPQGPYRARDSFGGKMEDDGGLKRMVEDVLRTMQQEKVITATKLNKVIISANSGGYRPAAFSLEKGGLNDHITDVFLFDAFYGQQEYYRHWLEQYTGTIHAIYTDHLAKAHLDFAQALPESLKNRFIFATTTEEHDNVVQTYLAPWLAGLSAVWKPDPHEKPQH